MFSKANKVQRKVHILIPFSSSAMFLLAALPAVDSLSMTSHGLYHDSDKTCDCVHNPQ